MVKSDSKMWNVTTCDKAGPIGQFGHNNIYLRVKSLTKNCNLQLGCSATIPNEFGQFGHNCRVKSLTKYS
jgi:hypothetical protein